MSLAPTDEQLEAACLAMEAVDPHAHPTAAGMRAVFALVRDMVLDEAERRLDAVESEDEVNFMRTKVIRTCDVYRVMQAIRAMKGNP